MSRLTRNMSERSENRPDPDVAYARRPKAAPHHSKSVAERLEYALHPWTSYAIIPLFALANAGVQLTPTALSTTLGSRVTTGVMLGLVVGKVVGISGFAWLAQRFRLATLPEDVRWCHIVGVSAVAGIGFTVALFIGALAFDSAVLQEQAKVGILAASALAAGVGVVVLRIAASAYTEGRLSRRSPI